MVEKEGAICLVSGGVDSVTMLYYVLHSFKPLDTLVIFAITAKELSTKNIIA